ISRGGQVRAARAPASCWGEECAIVSPMTTAVRARRLLAVLTYLAALCPADAAERRRCTVGLSPGDDLQGAVDGADRSSRARIVCLRSGEFRLGRFLSITRDGVVLRGEGASTVLRLDDGRQSPVIVIGDSEKRVPRRATS